MPADQQKDAPRPAVSVVLCTHNRADLLRDALEGALDQDLAPERYEVVVVDNDSTDDTPEVVRRAAAAAAVRVTRAPESSRGLSFARNRGIAESRGEVIVFADDDVLVGRGWLAALAAPFDDPEVMAAGGPIEPAWPGEAPAWLPAWMHAFLSIGDFPDAREAGRFVWPRQPWGANMAFRRRVFDELGDFPVDLGRVGTRLLSNEEVLLFRRIHERGWTVAFAADAVLRHRILPERLSESWFQHRLYWQGRSDAVMDLRYGGALRERLDQYLRFLTHVPLERERSPFEVRALRRGALGYLQGLLRPDDAPGDPDLKLRLRTLSAVDRAWSRAREQGQARIEEQQQEIERLRGVEATLFAEIQRLRRKLPMARLRRALGLDRQS